MKLWYIGFNLYNQINSSKELVISDFIKSEYEDIVDIILGHTFIIAQKSDSVELIGAFKNKICLEGTDTVKRITSVDNSIFILYSNGLLSKIDTVKGYISDISNFLNVEDPDGGKDYITEIACGFKINIALSSNNKLFNIPNKLDYKGRKIKQIVVGHEHCLILDQNGDVFSFGCGIRGQLGHGVLENETNPKLIETLAGIKIDKIAVGGWHSCAISVTGDLYTWGWNSNGQLGLPNQGDISVFATPQPVCFEDSDCNVENVACGSKHTVILIGGLLYGTGWNKYKQLGQTNENVHEFALLRDFCNEKIISIKCGPWCTAVVTK